MGRPVAFGGSEAYSHPGTGPCTVSIEVVSVEIFMWAFEYETDERLRHAVRMEDSTPRILEERIRYENGMDVYVWARVGQAVSGR